VKAVLDCRVLESLEELVLLAPKGEIMLRNAVKTITGRYPDRPIFGGLEYYLPHLLPLLWYHAFI